MTRGRPRSRPTSATAAPRRRSRRWLRRPGWPRRIRAGPTRTSKGGRDGDRGGEDRGAQGEPAPAALARHRDDGIDLQQGADRAGPDEQQRQQGDLRIARIDPQDEGREGQVPPRQLESPNDQDGCRGRKPDPAPGGDGLGEHGERDEREDRGRQAGEVERLAGSDQHRAPWVATVKEGAGAARVQHGVAAGRDPLPDQLRVDQQEPDRQTQSFERGPHPPQGHRR